MQALPQESKPPTGRTAASVSYSYNFATNRTTSCIGDKNCSKLVWCAFKEKAKIDIDKDGGLGVYPVDIRDSPMFLTLKSY